MWHRGLTCKLLRPIPELHLMQLIMKLVQNRNFILIIGNGKQNRRLKNGVPRGSILDSLLYVSDLPPTTSSKFDDANDVVFVHAAGDWQTSENI